jgi:hypothetical protein
MNKNLAAFTHEGGPYPSYISVNQIEDNVSITVRSPMVQRGYQPGAAAYIQLTKEQFSRLVLDLAQACAEPENGSR